MTNKVYTGDKTIEEHVSILVNLYGMPDKAANQAHSSRKSQETKQSIEMQQLKRDAGLV